jgi:hypothetical protein
MTECAFLLSYLLKLQKPEALTTFGRPDVKKNNLLDNRHIRPAWGGQFSPV